MNRSLYNFQTNWSCHSTWQSNENKEYFENAVLQNHADWYKPSFEFGALTVKNKVSYLNINVLTDQKPSYTLSCLLNDTVCIDSLPFLP